MAQNDPIRFHHIPDNSPLSKEHITDIIQDRQGLMWFGTRNGLVKYDGYQYEFFVHAAPDSTSLNNNYIFSIQEDQECPILWIGTKNGLGRFDMRTEQFKNYTFSPIDSFGLSSAEVVEVFQSSDGLLWLGLERGGLNEFNVETETFVHHYTNGSKGHQSGFENVGRVIEDEQGNIWYSTLGGVTRLERPSGDLILFPFEMDRIINRGLAQDANGQIYISTKEGLFKYLKNTNALEALPIDYSELTIKTGDISWSELGGMFDMFIDSKNQLWTGTMANQFSIQVNLNTFQTKVFRHNPLDNTSIGNTQVQTFCEDRDGRLWIGQWAGLSYWDTYLQKFNFTAIQKLPHLNGAILPITSIWKDTLNFLWVTSLGNGLNKIDLKTGEQEIFATNIIQQQPHNQIEKAFPYSDQLILLKNFSRKFLAYDKLKQTYVDFPNLLGYPSKPLDFFELGSNKISINYSEGEYILNTDSKINWKISDKIKQLGTFLKPLLIDSKGFYWYGLFNNSSFDGLVRYELETESYQIFQQAFKRFPKNASSQIPTLIEDAKGNFWMAYNGLYRIQLSRELTVKRWHSENSAIVSNQIFSLQEDNQENIWFNTEMGISRFNPQSEKFTFFGTEECGQRFFFVEPHSFKDENGFIYFGGQEGITWFHPQQLTFKHTAPPIIITEFKVNNQSASIRKNKINTSNSAPSLTQHIRYTQKITLNYEQNDFSFRLAILDYSKPEKNQYAYQLENYQNDWIYTDVSQRTVNFTNIPPGQYIFRAKGANLDGKWSETEQTIALTILKPWWQTWWAYTFYVLAIGGLLWSISNYELKRKLAQAEAQRLQELDNVKTKLYTNITHEFRTPLTVIQGMANKIQEQPKRWLEEGLHLINRNSNKLLHLINQILDLQKLEEGALSVNMIQGNIIDYLKYLVESFHSLAATKDILLHFQTSLDDLIMDYDPNKIQNIVTNLLANALKFTPENGDVYFSIRQFVDKQSNKEKLEIKVKDTGIGISQDKIQHVFDRFYQADDSAIRQAEGTGIGLALTKEFVQLLKGEIQVDSQLGKGTEFIIILPVSRNAEFLTKPLIPSKVSSVTIPLSADVINAATHNNKENPKLLIIEDNADVVSYLISCLAVDYNIEVAWDGKQGLEKAVESIPDFIISDVMMPKMDGYEVCRHLKEDNRTSHIPIILLTAKADASSKMEGLTSGADAYLTKPFNPIELQLRMEKLLELRQKLQERYNSLEFPTITQDKGFQKEDKFLSLIRQTLEANLSNENFGIVELCRNIGMSRVQLHRKLKSLTGQSTSHYLRNLRLVYAKQLLEQTNLNVSEVAYKVGFKSVAYFSTAFSKHFNYPPSALLKLRY